MDRVKKKFFLKVQLYTWCQSCKHVFSMFLKSANCYNETLPLWFIPCKLLCHHQCPYCPVNSALTIFSLTATFGTSSIVMCTMPIELAVILYWFTYIFVTHIAVAIGACNSSHQSPEYFWKYSQCAAYYVLGPPFSVFFFN